ncbi:MAG: hypothetical protein HYR96_03355 [Deltaproteobacteria bacterium]|nr:hypothetical protein [Deltaproteobacteria bacterium]MBI3294281.1 hypothetical protein [Deltaproteobacteria bacterium]
MKGLLAVVALVTLSVALGYLISRALNPRMPPAESISSKASYQLPQKITRLYAEPRPATAPPSISQDCQALWKALLALNLAQDFDPPKGSKCTGLPTPLDAFSALYNQRCAKRDDACLAAIHQYRARITHFSTKDVPLNSIRDPRILMDKLLATWEREPELAGAVADRWAELEPDNYPAQKAALISQLMAIAGHPPDPNDPRWTEINNRLDRLKRLEPKDGISQGEISCLASAFRDNDPLKVMERAAELDSLYPRSGSGPYFMGWAENRRGNREGSIKYVQECLRREPGNRRCQSTLAVLTTVSPQTDVGNAFSTFQSFPLAP